MSSEHDDEIRRLHEKELRRLAGLEARRWTRRIPRRVWKYLDNAGETEAMSAVSDFAVTGSTFLVLAGGVGTGKTVAASSFLDQPLTVLRRDVQTVTGFASRSGTALFLGAMDLVRAGTFDHEFWRAAEEADRLVIDDLGTEPQDEKGWAHANLVALLNYRYDSELKTIITTNLTLDGFKAAYCSLDGGRLLDRLREAGRFESVAGGSMRVRP